MYKLLIVILTFVIGGKCALVRVWDENNAADDYFISGTVLKPDEVPEKTVGLFVDKYSGDEDQVTEVANFPNLNTVWMYTIGQEVIVTFKNVPKLVEVDLSKNQMTYVSRSMFKDTNVEKIWLYNNMITTIEDKAFGKNVTIVSLYCNLLRTIKLEWFEDPSKITWLEFHGNKIESIKGNTFKAFTKLKDINLVMNEIHTINDGAFASRNIFGEIYLAYNKLKEIPSNAFAPQRVRIDNFDIRYNLLTYLPQELINRTSIGSIHLIDGNPWDCACYLKFITQWVNWEEYGQGTYHPKDREGEPRCVSKLGDDKNKCVEEVIEETIDYYLKNSSPPPNSREQYCPCRKTGKSWQECYHV